MAPSTAMLLAPEDAQSRPASVAVHSAASNSVTRRQQRASHTVVSGSQQREEDREMIPDVYSHRAAVAYAAAHPRRTIPKFGPYLLLQTLGEGEFGKVKLGLHSQWGEEVAVKLIRRGHVDITAVRMGKVEREIEVLRTLKHPNIVRLYDVIETDKYIGIILEYAAGGELFDYILAHRYLKERDASRLFAQLISGVWYIHQKKIVHRDLKLENLLLDRQRNVIITDFGFANRFEHRTDDLMQTSCGSPCYAAPELVISEGLYVGSAVDVWSCGVILYAMLAGYLPFDDDPANPDGDNINLLYKYIVNTPLSFPDYISDSARHLLSLMLVPDPKGRATLPTVMRHPWLSAHAGQMPELEGLSTDDGGVAFGNSVEDLEKAAMEQHQARRLAYQKQMRAQALETQPRPPPATQSGHMSMQIPPSSASRSQSHHVDNYNTTMDGRAQAASQQPEYLYESSSPVDQSLASSVYPIVPPVVAKRGHSSTVVTSNVGMDMDDPFAMPGTSNVIGSTPVKRQREQDAAEGEKKSRKAELIDEPTATLAPESARNKKGEFRHTIQVEYDSQPSPSSKDKRKERNQAASGSAPRQQKTVQNGTPIKPLPETPTPQRRQSEKEKPKEAVQKPQTPPNTFSQPSSTRTPPASRQESAPSSYVSPPIVSINPASPPSTPGPSDGFDMEQKSSRHRKGTGSISGGLGLGRIFGSGGEKGDSVPSSRVPSESSTREPGESGSVGKTSLQPPSVYSNASGTPSKDAYSEKKKGRRNTLTVMVEPFGFGKSNKNKTKGASGRDFNNPIDSTPKGKTGATSAAADESFISGPQVPLVEATPVRNPQHAKTMPASTSKATRVMYWFRSKSKARDSINVGPVVEQPVAPTQVVVTPPSVSKRSQTTPMNKPPLSTRPTAEPPTTPNVFSRIRNSVTVVSPASGRDREQTNVPMEKRMRIHHGAVDQTTVTTGKPPMVMNHVKSVLQDMGVEVQLESEFKYRCVRAKRRRMDGGSVAPSGESIAAFSAIGSAASNGVDRRGLPVPSSFHAGGMLRGLLMRRQSSQVSSGSQPSLAIDEEITPTASPNSPLAPSAAGIITSEPTPLVQTVYGDHSQDVGDEVRFSVELTKIDRLEGTYSVDIRRLKGNLRSYKFLYDTIRDRADLQQVR